MKQIRPNSQEEGVDLIMKKEAIRQEYLKAKDEKTTLVVLTNIFNALDKVLLNNEGSWPKGIEELIKAYDVEAPRMSSFLDKKAMYPVNKHGSFGALYRECKIVDMGVEERDGCKPFVLKQIIGFKNNIETEKTLNNEKL
jgi:hypothetical protein